MGNKCLPTCDLGGCGRADSAVAALGHVAVAADGAVGAVRGPDAHERAPGGEGGEVCRGKVEICRKPWCLRGKGICQFTVWLWHGHGGGGTEREGEEGGAEHFVGFGSRDIGKQLLLSRICWAGRVRTPLFIYTLKLEASLHCRTCAEPFSSPS